MLWNLCDCAPAKVDHWDKEGAGWFWTKSWILNPTKCRRAHSGSQCHRSTCCFLLCCPYHDSLSPVFAIYISSCTLIVSVLTTWLKKKKYCKYTYVSPPLPLPLPLSCMWALRRNEIQTNFASPATFCMLPHSFSCGSISYRAVTFVFFIYNLLWISFLHHSIWSVVSMSNDFPMHGI